jgi:hypothetical protein
MESLSGCDCTCIEGILSHYSLNLFSIIRLCRRDGQVDQGVALEQLYRLLFTEGSNPPLSLSSTSAEWIKA